MGCRPTTREVPFETLLILPLRNGLTKPKAQRGSGVKMISMGELFSSNRIGCMPMDRVPVTDKELELSCIAPSDLLFARQSLVLEGAGKCSFVKEVSEPTVFESHLIRARIDRAKAEPEYLYYFFKSPQGRERIASIVEQVAAAGIRGRDLARLSIPCPELDFQRRVVTLLSCIDNKIDANAKLNGYLEELCDALFLDFLEQADSSWHEGTLEELAEVKYGKDHKKLADGPYPVYGSGGFMRSAEKSLFSGESVLIPRKGSLNNVMYVNEAFWTVDTLFFTVPRIPGAAKFLYQYVKRLNMASMNSGSAVPSMTTSILNALSLPVPPRDSLLSFNAKLQSMYDAVRANNLENRRLESLRDSLLPKLMTGEIDVSKIDLTQLNSHLTECVQEIKEGAVEPNLTFYSSKHPAIVELLIHCGKMVLGIIQSHPVAFFANALDGVFEGPVKLLDAGIHLIKHDLILVHSHQ